MNFLDLAQTITIILLVGAVCFLSHELKRSDRALRAGLRDVVRRLRARS